MDSLLICLFIPVESCLWGMRTASPPHKRTAMQYTYICRVEHAQGQQFATIQARDIRQAEHRLKALGYTLITTPTKFEE